MTTIDDVRCASDLPAPSRPVAWTWTWESGPDAGEQAVLAHGRTIVGRANGAGVRCDDPTIEPHHALLVLDGDGLRIVQLTGRAPLVVGGHPIEGVTPIGSATLVELGESTLRLRQGPLDAPPAAHVRAATVLRDPRQVARWEEPPLVTPAVPPLEAGHRPGGLVPALCGLVGAAVLAAVVHQWMFLVFGLLGTIVTVASWCAQRVGVLRGARRDRRDARGRRGRSWPRRTSRLATRTAGTCRPPPPP